MRTSRQPLADVLAGLPREWPDDPQPIIAAALQASQEKIVILDDDPTGGQTVHQVPVVTEWSLPTLTTEMKNDLPAFFLLTNSRSLPLPEARALHTEIGHSLREAAGGAGKRLVIVSRSDSTLRGHFPGEIDVLGDALAMDFDAWLLIPFFQEGGRYTIDDTQYVLEGDVLVPAGETEFARDPAFGYWASNLPQWVEEKTAGRVRADTVASVSLDDIRVGGPARVASLLGDLVQGRICVVNAASRRDLEVFTQGLLAAEATGKRFLYRTAASFVQVRLGISPRQLLTPEDLGQSGVGGGLIVVGSHVPRTTSQLQRLLCQPEIVQVEIEVRAVLDDASRGATIAAAAETVEVALRQGRDVALFTSRQLVAGTDAAGSLAIAQRISQALVAIVQSISTRPRYLLAKGGITSSDVATQGLGVKRAMVLGQVLPGVPVWQLGPETRYPGLAYIVFPGNVGGPEAVRDTVLALRLQRG